MAYDPRTGKQLRAGVTQDFSKYTGSLAYNPETGNRVSADALKQQPRLAVTQPKPVSADVGLATELTGMAKTGVDTYTQNLQAKSKETETAKTSSLDSYINNLSNRKGATELQDQAYSKTVDPLEGELNEINNQILAKSEAFRSEREMVQNDAGLTLAQKNARLNDISRKQSSELADLSVTQMAKQGRYDSAKEIADRAINVQLERDKNLNEALKLNYEENKDLFTTAEKRAFESAQNDRERVLDKEEENLKTISDMSITALQNGAPSSIASKMRQAKTVDEAIRVGGNYMSDPVERAIKAGQLKKIQQEIAENDLVLTPNTPSGSTSDVMAKFMNSAKYDKQLDATERQSLTKSRNVINQLDALQSNIAKQNKTGLLKGKAGNLLEKIGLNADVGTINAQLQAITPNLARGVYGEVGVLTDNDVKLYRTTLPRLDRPEDQNAAIMALTLKTVQKSIENTLSSAANSGIDVSGWVQDYNDITQQINEVEDRIGVSKAKVLDFGGNYPEVQPMIKELQLQGATDREILQILGI